ncbi:hypothetical protein QBC40DRAFT_255567 [Triangularia verruculosa]|uniref:Uncharacterized protein n=1 Tax=Triangularia verruculosa TaxID=2587418 RepID=A0AAN6XE31_9PEZI|nr:hypothetical protein QBC40DRAFT_255567 [Triangularia verruculosa]
MVGVAFFTTILFLGLGVLAAPADINGTLSMQARTANDDCDPTQSYCHRDGREYECDPALGHACMHVKYCEHTWWTGDCIEDFMWNGECRNTLEFPKYENSISSCANENMEHSMCHWFDGLDCQGAQYSNQKDANLADGNGWWNDRISSYRCDWYKQGS